MARVSHILLRFTPDERELIDRALSHTRLSQNMYLVRAALGEARRTIVRHEGS